MATSTPTYIRTVKEGLNFRTVDEIKKLLGLLPIQNQATRKADLIDTIANYLLGSGLKTLWQDLDELQQAAVAEALYLTGGRHEAAQFKAKYGALPQWHDRGFYSYRRPAAKLDLFFYPTGNYRASELLPLDLRQKLKAFVPQPRALTLPSSEQPPQTFRVQHRYFDYEQRKSVETIDDVPVVCCSTEQLAQQDLLAVLRLIHLGKVSVSDKTSMPSKTTIKAITPLLQGGDYYSEADEPERQHDDSIGSIKPFAWTMLVACQGEIEG
jgi:hypothetical protein